MATVYNIEIKTVSAFVNYPEKEIENLFQDFLKTYKNSNTNLGFESTEIKIKKK